MNIRTCAKLGLAAASLLAIAACSSSQPSALQTAKSVPAMLSNKKPAPPVVSPQQINALLASSGKPSSVFVIEQTTAQFIMVEVERNGRMQTFGSSSRQAIVVDRGKMVSTRGFGGDLMSSEEGALMAKVRSRSAGTVNYAQRFLTSDNRTITSVYECKLATGGSVPVALGAVNSKGTVVTADCSDPYVSFTNTYVVESGGYILSGRQWMGPTIGYMNIQPIRK